MMEMKKNLTEIHKQFTRPFSLINNFCSDFDKFQEARYSYSSLLRINYEWSLKINIEIIVQCFTLNCFLDICHNHLN